MQPRRPDLVIVGPPKCGTSSLHAALSQLPEVITHRSPELHFWSQRELRSRLGGPGDRAAWSATCRTEAAYSAAFTGSGGGPVVECSPSYLFFPDVADRLISGLERPKIVVMLRDPVERLWSQYWHQVRAGHEKLEIRAALDAEAGRWATGWSDIWQYRAHSRYAEGLGRYLGGVGASNVFVFRPGELTDPHRLLEFTHFAGLATDITDLPRVNAGGKPKAGGVGRVLGLLGPAGRRAIRVLPPALRRVVRDLAVSVSTEPIPPMDARLSRELAAEFEQDQAEVLRLLTGTAR